MKPVLAVLTLLLVRAQAQLPDLDEFSQDLELDLPAGTPAPAVDTSTLPPNHLFSGWELVKELTGELNKLKDGEILHLVLPPGPYLVAPNVPGIREGYRRISTAVTEETLQSGQLLKVVLHADGNFSTALFLSEAPGDQLPPGLDISPVPKTHLVGLITDIQVLDRASPLILNAFVRLQRQAAAEGIRLDRREFIFLPIEPGRVFFGLERRPAAAGGNSRDAP